MARNVVSGIRLVFGVAVAEIGAYPARPRAVARSGIDAVWQGGFACFSTRVDLTITDPLDRSAKGKTMSNSYDTSVSGRTGVDSMDSPGSLDTAKREASELTHTAADRAKGVVDTAKDEASSVLHEAKYQAKDLFAQTRREMTDQARTQQQRVAGGLRTVGGDLRGMAEGAPSDSVATDLVRQVSDRLSSAATWLSEREPTDVLVEVKRFARRKPGVFILGAVITGVVVGRLTRALTTNAVEAKDAASRADTRSTPPVSADAWTPAPSTAPTGAAPDVDETPIYAQSSGELSDAPITEDGDVRSHTL
jgi:hypothetical protein